MDNADAFAIVSRKRKGQSCIPARASTLQRTLSSSSSSSSSSSGGGGGGGGSSSSLFCLVGRRLFLLWWLVGGDSLSPLWGTLLFITQGFL
jgi:hypothetical protein